MAVNPDAAADYAEICDVVEQKLVPTFEMLGRMLKEIDDKASQALNLATAIVNSMNDAVTGNKRDQFSSMLGSRFSADLGPIDQFYSDTKGTKYSDELIDELLNSEPDNPEEYISSRIGEMKNKYGKYLGQPPAPEMPPEMAAAGAEEEEVAAHPEGQPAVAVEVKAKPKTKKVTSRDMADYLGVRLNPK